MNTLPAPLATPLINSFVIPSDFIAPVVKHWAERAFHSPGRTASNAPAIV